MLGFSKGELVDVEGLWKGLHFVGLACRVELCGVLIGCCLERVGERVDFNLV